MDVAAMVLKIRGDRTQEQFAADLGCSRQSVVWWETGRFKPGKAMLLKLGISVHYEDGNPNSERTVERGEYAQD
jgi:DNA-binding XRE family transcriptional regulator